MPQADLARHPEFVPLVAGWIWEEWPALLVQKSRNDFEVWFRASRRERALPATFIWLEDGEPVGTVSLEVDDMETRPELTPWLASLYVLPAWRGRGLGRQLVRAAEDQARAMGLLELYLYTPGQEPFYTALGWELLERGDYRGAAVSILRRRL